MIVVSDTTPLNYLILVDSVHVLPALFGRVYAPSAVITELSHRKTPEAVRNWAASPPMACGPGPDKHRPIAEAGKRGESGHHAGSGIEGPLGLDQ